MKILQVNKFFYVSGGSGRYFFEVSKLLKLHGHKVAYFSMKDPKNYKSKWSVYFINNISYEKSVLKDIPGKIVNMIYSNEARANISKLLDDFKPDIVHLHSIYHQISPSILLEIAKRNIPVVQTVHDHHLISPNQNQFHNGKICEIAKQKNFYKAVIHRCVKNSYFFSTAEVLEKYIHSVLGWDTGLVDYLISPSIYLKKKLVSYGIDRQKLIHLPYFVQKNTYIRKSGEGSFVLYFGRLSEEKGLRFLVSVFRHLQNINLCIIGTGPEEKYLKDYIRVNKFKNIKLLGYVPPGSLRDYIAGCRFAVMPSLCSDVFPNSVLEAGSSGKPVIASDIGGIPEMITDGFNGFLCKAGNQSDFRNKILKLWNNRTLNNRFGVNARKNTLNNFNPDAHYRSLMSVYNRAIMLHQ